MSYCYCTKCESVYRREDVKMCCGNKNNLIDWAEFADILYILLRRNMLGFI